MEEFSSRGLRKLIVLFWSIRSTVSSPKTTAARPFPEPAAYRQDTILCPWPQTASQTGRRAFPELRPEWKQVGRSAADNPLQLRRKWRKPAKCQQ